MGRKPNRYFSGNVKAILSFRSYVLGATNTSFEFIFNINIGNAKKGAHTGVLLTAVKHRRSRTYYHSLVVEFLTHGLRAKAGTEEYYLRFDVGGQQKLTGSTKKIPHYLWCHNITENAMIDVLAEVQKESRFSHKYSEIKKMPGVLSNKQATLNLIDTGHNCTTYAMKLARKAGFSKGLDIYRRAMVTGSSPSMLLTSMSRSEGWVCKRMV